MAQFIQSIVIQAPVETVFGFHERADALELLTPKFPPARVVSKTGGITPGAQVVLQIGPTKWVALHTDYVPNKLFVDEQISGPFKRWVHRHEFESLGAATRLTDHVDYELHGGRLVTGALGWAVNIGLHQMFRHRHEVTRQYCER